MKEYIYWAGLTDAKLYWKLVSDVIDYINFCDFKDAEFGKRRREVGETGPISASWQTLIAAAVTVFEDGRNYAKEERTRSTHWLENCPQYPSETKGVAED